MSLVETRYEHIVLDDAGVPLIAGTTMKVIELVLEHAAHGWSPEELHFQHPYLSLGQIYSALAYYWDHQDELDQDIARSIRTGGGTPPHHTALAVDRPPQSPGITGMSLWHHQLHTDTELQHETIPGTA